MTQREVGPTKSGVTPREQRLAAAGRVAAGLLHDFNNQLGTISNLAFVLGRVADDPAKVRELSERLGELTRVRGRVADRVRSFMRQDAQRFPDTAILDLAAVAREAMRMAQPFAEARGSRGAVRLVEGTLPSARVRGEGSELREAVFELLLNAIEASEAGQSIEVDTAVADGRAVLTVRDHGAGLREGMAEFGQDPFISSKQEPDAGLGLSAAWGTAQRHGGDVTLQADGAGTTVAALSLPLSAQEP